MAVMRPGARIHLMTTVAGGGAVSGGSRGSGVVTATVEEAARLNPVAGVHLVALHQDIRI